MKMGQLEQHCGNCAVIDYCAEPFNDLCLCTDSRLEEIEEKEYMKLAENSCKPDNESICEEVILKLQDQGRIKDDY